MEDQSMTTNDTQPPITAKEAKAQAKAAVAYAKAQQNWFLRHKILTAILALVVIGIIASAAGGGGSDKKPAASAGNTSDANPTADSNAGGEPNASSEEADNSSKGKGPIVWGNWETVGPVKIKDDGTHSFGVDMRVMNNSDSPDEGMFTVTVLDGQEILGTVDCTTATVEPGKIGTANCFGFDPYKKGWTEFTIENTF